MESVTKYGYLYDSSFVHDVVELLLAGKVEVVAIYIESQGTLTEIEVAAGETFEPSAPDGFCPAIVARTVEVDYILVGLVEYLEEVLLVLFSHASLA